MKSSWTSSVERMTFGLSPQKPIQLIHHNWSDKHVSQFDMHFGMELGIVLSGGMRRHYRDFEQTLGAGDIWLCSLWEPHGFHLSEAPCSAVVFMIYPPLISNLHFEEEPDLKLVSAFHASPQDRPSVTKHNRQSILEIGRNLFEKTEPGIKNQLNSPAWIRVKLLEVMIHLLERWDCSTSSSPVAADKIQRLNPALELVFSSRGHVSATHASEVCHMHRNTFRQIFSDAMGLNFPEFALRYRLSRAAGELSNSHKPIKKISADWGFTDTSHFVKAFAKYYHQTPAVYRSGIKID